MIKFDDPNKLEHAFDALIPVPIDKSGKWTIDELIWHTIETDTILKLNIN